MNNPAAIGEVYLLADPMPMTLGEILSVLREMQGRPLTTIPIPKTVIRILLALIGRSDLWLRFAGDLVVDTGKFQALGWRPTTDTARGLAAMLETQDGQSVSAMQRSCDAGCNATVSGFRPPPPACLSSALNNAIGGVRYA